MKKYILLSILFLTACAGEFDVRVYPTATIAETAVPTWTATSTLEPTPTIGYEATAHVAQTSEAEQRLLAEAAERLNVKVTAEEEQRIQQRLAWTAQSDQWTAQASQWTATAVGTSVPLTSTQQAVLNTQIPAQQALMSAQMTATQGAPTLMVAMRDAEIAVYYAPVKAIGILFALFTLGIFFLSMSYNLYKDDQRKRERMVRQQDAEAGAGAENEAPTIIHPIDLPMTTIQMTHDHGGGFSSSKRLMVPCSEAQLTELAEGLISGRKTLAFNQWEGKSSQHFTRPVFQQVRAFLQINKLAKSAAGAGNLMLTDEGEAFFRKWLDTRSLPHSYEFGPESQGLQGESAHDHENHAHDFPVGEFLRVTAQAEEDSAGRLAARRLI